MCATRARDPFSRQTHRRDNGTGSWTTAIFQASQPAGAGWRRRSFFSVCDLPKGLAAKRNVWKNVKRSPEDWPWSSYNNFGLDRENIKHCPMRIDDVHLPESRRG
jgi:hypothetical protein